MSRVWIPKAAHHDFREAERFGQLCYVFDDPQDPRKNPEGLPRPVDVSPFQLEAIADAVRQRIKDGHITAEDYLIICGPATMVALTYAEWRMRLGTVNVLIYHARNAAYVLRTVRG